MKQDAAFALAKFIADTKYEDLPREVVEHTKKDILDTLGVTIIGGALGQGSKEIVNLVKDGGGKPESTILGFGGKVPCWMAAFANGAMAHSWDYDDFDEEACGHAGITAIPAPLALSERVGRVNGKQFITAVAVGLEIIRRVGLAANPRRRVTGQWGHAMLCGYFGAAAAAGKILGFDEGRMVDVLGHAYSQASGGYEIFAPGSLKGIYAAFPGKAGVLAALLAQSGIPGPKNSFEGKAGLYNLYFRGDYDPIPLTRDLGKTFELLNIGFKPWPCCGFTHRYVEATLDIVQKHNVGPRDVIEIKAFVEEPLRYLCEPLEIRQMPRSVTEAQLSIPYVIAVAATKRAVRVESFTSEGLKDRAILEVCSKVVPQYDFKAKTRGFSGKVEIKTNQGTYVKQVDEAYGAPEKPLSMGTLLAKFRDCASYSVNRLSAKDIDAVIDLLVNLETVKDVSQITGLLS